MKFKLRDEFVDRGRIREFSLYRINGESKEVHEAAPLVFNPLVEGVVQADPFCSVKTMGGDLRVAVPPELMAIFEGLWDMGIRPTAFEDRTRETGAIRDHLEDMRRLALKDKFVKLKGM